jgi:hypothetical protein
MSISEVIPRHVEENPYNYTPLEKAERSKAMKDMARDYPNLPHSWLEMVYDFWKHTPVERVEEIVNNGEWDKPGRFSNSSGGTIHTMTILDKDTEPLKQRYKNVKGLDGDIV